MQQCCFRSLLSLLSTARLGRQVGKGCKRKKLPVKHSQQRAIKLRFSLLVRVSFPAPLFQEITTEPRFPRLKLSHRCPQFHSGSAVRDSGLRHAVPPSRSLFPTSPSRRSGVRFTPRSAARKQNHSQPPRAIVSGTIGTRLSPRIL